MKKLKLLLFLPLCMWLLMGSTLKVDGYKEDFERYKKQAIDGVSKIAKDKLTKKHLLCCKKEFECI